MYTEWNDKGEIILQGNYKDWGKEGSWRGYYDNGNKKFEEFYQNGALMKTRSF